MDLPHRYRLRVPFVFAFALLICERAAATPSQPAPLPRSTPTALPAATCGDGVLDSTECCDDGNTVDGDGCSASCQSESALCGNGIVECPEQCDDGNLVSGDGCSPSCERQCLPGDLNSSTTVTSNDIICLVNYVFLRLRGICDMWPCQFVGDVNCNGTVTSADIIYLVNYIFKSGAPPCNSCAECGL